MCCVFVEGKEVDPWIGVARPQFLGGVRKKRSECQLSGSKSSHLTDLGLGVHLLTIQDSGPSKRGLPFLDGKWLVSLVMSRELLEAPWP